MEKLETLQLGPAQALHLIRVDGKEILVAIGAGSPAIISAHAVPIPREVD